MDNIDVYDDSDLDISKDELEEFSVGAMLPVIPLTGHLPRMEFDAKNATEFINTSNEALSKLVNLNESSLDRSKVKEEDFGIPELKKYPMPDKKHVILAIRMFNHVDKPHEKQLAKAIIKKMHEYHIQPDMVGDKNRLKKYLPKHFKESVNTIKGDEPKMAYTATNLVDSMWKSIFESDESNKEDTSKKKDDSNEKTPDPIKHIVLDLEGKGYRVKYSSPGYMDSHFKRDKNNDGVINGKTASSARIVFSKNYRFNTTPKYWEWKVMDNGFKALYVKPMSENDDPNQLSKWKEKYMQSLETWVKNLPMAGAAKDEESKPDENFSAS